MDHSESARRTQIVTATRKLIEDRGIAQITTKQIAKAAGCAEGTIFRHFARKEDLLLAAVMASFPSLRESLISISGGTPRERFQRLALNVIRFFEQITPAAVAVLANAELTRRHRETMREHNGGPQRLYIAVSRFIESEPRWRRRTPPEPTSFGWNARRSIDGHPVSNHEAMRPATSSQSAGSGVRSLPP